jgi:hypothetical protein
MNVRIEGSTSLWTEIEVRDANGDLVFDGVLEMEPDWYVLRRKSRGMYDENLKRWAGRRQHLAVLADAIAFVAKATGSAPC